MKTGWKSTLAGVLDIISGVFALVFVGLMAANIVVLKSPPPPLQFYLIVVTAFFAALAALAVAGGIYALRGKMGWLALAGSLAASVCLLPLGFAATLLVLLSARFSGLARLLILLFFIPVWAGLLLFFSLVLLGYAY